MFADAPRVILSAAEHIDIIQTNRRVWIEAASSIDFVTSMWPVVLVTTWYNGIL